MPRLNSVMETPVDFGVERIQVMCLSVAVANVEQPKNEIELNVQLAANFLASLLKKNWQNIKVRKRHRPSNSSYPDSVELEMYWI